jgi:hypothetical protein
MKRNISEEDLAGKKPALRRLVSFVLSKGKPSIIAKEIGMSPNIFTNMIDRDTNPSYDMIYSLHQVYPDLDIHYIFTGTDFEPLVELKKQIKTLEAEAKHHKSVVTKLVGKDKGVSNHPQVDREGASELLDKIMKKGMKTQNLAYLQTYLRNPCRQ